MPRKKNNYLSNSEILPEIIQYKETGIASEKYGEIILAIATGLAQKPNFIGYSWKDDMISFAVLTCLKYSKGFNPEKYNNPFAYLTTICYNAFQAYLNTQKKHSTIKDECYKKQSMISEDPYSAIDYTEMKRSDGNPFIETEKE